MDSKGFFRAIESVAGVFAEPSNNRGETDGLKDRRNSGSGTGSPGPRRRANSLFRGPRFSSVQRICSAIQGTPRVPCVVTSDQVRRR
jgi:hypothetical protein